MTTATATKTFDRIRKELDREHAARLADSRHYIEKGYFPTWAEEHRTDPDRGLKAHSTAKKWEAYKAGELSREKAVEIAYKRAAKEEEKHHAKNVEKLSQAEAAAPPEDIAISIDWKKSYMWGYCPTATVTVHSADGWRRYTGTAGGCGYDKLTAAVGEALNQSPAVLNMLYAAKEKAYRKSTAAARKAWGTSNRTPIHYGAGYGILPYFEGGVGWSSFAGVFAACGYKITASHETKTSNYFYIEKAGRK